MPLPPRYPGWEEAWDQELRSWGKRKGALCTSIQSRPYAAGKWGRRMAESQASGEAPGRTCQVRVLGFMQKRIQERAMEE